MKWEAWGGGRRSVGNRVTTIHMPRPFYSVGLLFNLTDASPAFLGTCFGVGTGLCFLTAAHCIGTLPPARIGIVLPLVDHGDIIPVATVERHPTADLALMQVRMSDGPSQFQPFVGLSAIHWWGEDVQALGYPEDADEAGVTPTGRLFSGTIQRFYTHGSNMGYKYRAGELSFGAPAGLSGGPVFASKEHDRVVGLVAENRNSTTFLQSVSEIQENNRVYREHIHEVIRYGIFVHLVPYGEWLEGLSPGAFR